MTTESRIHSSKKPRHNPFAFIRERLSEPFLFSTENKTMPTSQYVRLLNTQSRSKNHSLGREQNEMVVKRKRAVTSSSVQPQKKLNQAEISMEEAKKDPFINSCSPFIREFIQLSSAINSERRSIFLPNRCKLTYKPYKRPQ